MSKSNNVTESDVTCESVHGVKKTLCSDMERYLIQNKKCENSVGLDIEDFRNKFLRKAYVKNPVLVHYNICNSQLFHEFKEYSCLDNSNQKFDIEGFLAIDLFNREGESCGVLALGRRKGEYKSKNLFKYVIGQDGVSVFNKNITHPKINYCTDNLEVALKIAQCGERVACASRLSDCVEFFLNTTVNSPIAVNKSKTITDAFSLFDEDMILKFQTKLKLQGYLQQLYKDFSKQYGAVNEDPEIKGSHRDEIKIVNMNDIEAVPIQWLWPGWLPLGKMTILAGAGGCGKTTLTLALISTITTDGIFPDGTRCENSGKVLIYSTEDDPADTLKPRLIANGADINQVSIIAGCTNQKGEIVHFDPVKDFPKIESYVKANPDLKLLMIDPIISAVSGDMNKANDVRRSLQPLVDLASQYGFAILGITHFSKGGVSNNPADRILGSQAFTALPRMAWCAVRREAEGDYILARAKSNNSTLEGGLRYQIEPVHILNEIETTKINWLGGIDGTASELLKNAELGRDEDNSAVAKAKKFLIRLLGNVDKMPSTEVLEKANEAKVTLASLRRARELLDIECFRVAGEKGWYWSLQQIHSLDDPT
ncbi:AAA family ATPase [Acinetobacter wanghuae]|uniref:AAA family ATPase n=1 Tax=Acinetobacter wanghuae TaxID=2662362 RepID=A0ABX6D0K9_9GAMM|nr:AAA family ATPase [Acinetobacter wanghuae]QGA11348.1 AAA family ATPase [Acinetobacter wanghuae]